MFTAIQTLRSKRNSWFKRSSPIKEEEDKPNRSTMEASNSSSPIIANRDTMCLESISRIKKIKLNEDSDVTIFENPRSCNGVIKSWCITSKPVKGNSCIGMLICCYPIFNKLINQLVSIKAEWKVQISMHVTVVSNSNSVSEFEMLSNKIYSKELYDLQHYYISTFEYFEKTIVSRTNCYYFITFVKFSIVV